MSYAITYMWNLKYDTNELIYKTETNSIDMENRLTVAKMEKGWGRDGLGVWGQQMQTIIYLMGKQQGPTVQYGELYSTFFKKP